MYPMGMSKQQVAEIARYLFFGVLTTGVNLSVFFILATLLHVDANLANIASVAAAIVFAFFVNKKYVFKSTSFAGSVLVREGGVFVSARLISMAVELGGFFVLYSLLDVHEYLSKFFIAFIVVTLNYFASKFLIFSRKA